MIQRLIRRILPPLAAACLALTACAPAESPASADNGALTWGTWGSYGRHKPFLDLLAQVCPDIELEFISYAGGNATGYSWAQMRADDIPDIFITSQILDRELAGDRLADLSGYDFVNGFSTAILDQVAIDGGVYLLPVNNTMYGIYYNKTLMEEKGWEVPTTWDEMWELGDKAKEEDIYLFTYPTTGYFDAFLYALMYSAGGPEFFDKATHYEEGIWETPEAQKCFDIVAKLAEYTEPTTPAQANDQDFTKNQQLVLDNKALFMPNGTWIVGEMAEAPRADGFKWGMTALPAVEAGGDGYSYTWFEQAWIPGGAANQDGAKQFIAFLYSDAACAIFAKANAIQPVLNIAQTLEGDNQMFYAIYDNGAKAAMGNFAAYDSGVIGVTNREIWFDPVNSLVSGNMTEQEWIDGIKEVNDQMRDNLIQ